MKCESSGDIIHKDVVVVGNGPSGIALSYMLSGNVPYVTSNEHPDEFLAARLAPTIEQSLAHQDLGHLSSGLEGRTTNPVSLLLDCLIHPCADIGLEMDPLVEWRKDGPKIDHVVLGKGPPGGSWHSMDPEILTLSLGSWMALPGMEYDHLDGSEKRASAKNVADYYSDYVESMGLSENFSSNVLVTSVRPYVDDTKSKWVEKVHSDVTQKVKLCTRPELKEFRKFRTCTLANAFNYFVKVKPEKCHRRKDFKIENPSDKKTIIENDCEYRLFSEPIIGRLEHTITCEPNLCDRFYRTYRPSVPSSKKLNCDQTRWIVETYDLKTRTCVTYTCNHLVLANGSSDLPNRLSVSNEKTDPYWLLHDLRSLEIELDLHLQLDQRPDPVLVVGAGLSAADAIIATRGRNVPVLHLFRNRSENLGKQLPENMYPEYHKVHQMMKPDSTYPLYTALSEYELIEYDESNRTVSLRTKNGDLVTVKVSFAVVLIGSRPDLGFLPDGYNLAAKKHMPIDCKSNTVHIDRLNHSVQGYDGLYAMGPLAGDNFVRFLPGGALAILSDLYKKYGY